MFILLSVPPSNSVSSSLTILTTCSPGFNDFITSWPRAFSCTFDINSLTIL